MIAANGSWFWVEKDLLNYWNCIFVVQSRISYLVGHGGRGVRPSLFFFMEALIRRLVFIRFSCSTHVAVLPATFCSLSTETLVQKLLVYMKHFLIRLEINILSSYKFDGDDGSVTVFCFRIEVWTSCFLGWGRVMLLLLLKSSDFNLVSNMQKLLIPLFPDPFLFSLIYRWIT